jgi:hypothetical protein
LEGGAAHRHDPGTSKLVPPTRRADRQIFVQLALSAIIFDPLVA